MTSASRLARMISLLVLFSRRFFNLRRTTGRRRRLAPAARSLPPTHAHAQSTTSTATTMAEEEKKNDEKGDHINLKVKDQDNSEVHFKVRQTTKFSKVRARNERPHARASSMSARERVPSRPHRVFRRHRVLPPRSRSNPARFTTRSRAWTNRGSRRRRPSSRSLLAPSSRQIFDAFCARKSLQPDSVRFLFDGQRVNANMTPKDVRAAPTPSP